MSADLHYNPCHITASGSQAGHFAASDTLLLLLTRVCAAGVWQEPWAVRSDCTEGNLSKNGFVVNRELTTLSPDTHVEERLQLSC